MASLVVVESHEKGGKTGEEADGVSQLQVGCHPDDLDGPELHPIFDMMKMHIYVLGPIRFCLSGGPFNTTPIIFKYFNLIWGLVFESFYLVLGEL